MIRLKHGVSLANLQPQMLLALSVAESIYSNYDLDLVVTSVNDSYHSHTSLHYAGCAIDIRTKTLPNYEVKRRVCDEIKSALETDFDVILESVDTDNEHIHIEYQPRRR